MRDVADLAGVSHQTVSRVLNSHPNVSPLTRERVEKAVRQLGYRRNHAARALATRRMMTVGVVSFAASHYGPASTLFGITEAARQAGYSVSLVTLRHIDRRAMQAALDRLTMISVDGIVVIAPVVAAAAAVKGLPVGAPLVMVEAGAEQSMTSVKIDQVLGARRATRHLLELGHRSVWHVSGPEGWIEAEARTAGWRAELKAAKRTFQREFVGDWSSASGFRAGREIARHREITAVFAANDQMALGVLRALGEEGLTVPGDVSVVGFDDVPEAGYFQPPLTTVRQDFEEIGRCCIERLLGLLHGGCPAPIRPVEPTLVIRASTGPPPSNAP